MSNTERSSQRFSNTNIFERREKELKLKNKSFTQRKLNKTAGHFFLKQKKQQSKKFDFTLLSNSTTNLLKEISTLHSIRLNMWNKIFNEPQEKEEIRTNNIINNKNISHIMFSRTNIGFNKSDMFITENRKFNDTNYISSYNKFNNSLVKRNDNPKMIISLKDKKNIKRSQIPKSMINSKSNPLFFNNKNNIDNTYILKQQNEKTKIKDIKGNLFNKTHRKNNNSLWLDDPKLEKYFKKLFDQKIKSVRTKKDNSFIYVEKLKEFKLLEYQTNLVKEKKTNFIENRKNDINYYDDYSRNLQNTENLLDKKLAEKLADYMRFIYFRIEEEKYRENFLIKKILFLKDQIRHLNSKIRRLNLEKEDILKWIYLQIKIKERRLIIPNHYKMIIENKQKDSNKESIVNKTMRTSLKESKKNIKFNFDSFSSRKSFKIKRLINQSQKELYNYRNIGKESDKNNIIEDDEIKRIQNYLKYPIFNDIEELMDYLDIFKNEIMFKSQDYYNLKIQIFNEKNHLLKYKNQLEQEKNNYEKILIQKGTELVEIKEISNINNSTKIDIKQNKNDDSFLMNIFKFKNKKIRYDNYPLIYKINSIYENCKVIQLSKKQYNFFDRKASYSHPLIEEILHKLKYITKVTDTILLEFKYYKNNDPHKREIIRKMKSDIDKKRKDAKNLESKLKEKQKAIKLLNKIEERNNRILFLSFRKVNKYNTISKKKKSKTKRKKKNSFDDFKHE